jgi:LysR family transcriptional activator of nhaA
VLRRGLNQWFHEKELRPRIVAEFHDSALLKVFGENGSGVFAAPSAIEKEIEVEYGVKLVGRTQDVIERFYLISVERRIRNSAVAAISANAKELVFGNRP